MKQISIIIATYNASKYLQFCLKSILIQKSTDIELILIDGGSTDETINIIKENQSIIDYWVSEPDFGIYDAWNKGIKRAKGEWVMFLGADDELLPKALDQYKKFLYKSKSEEYDLISSQIQVIDKNGNKIRKIGFPYQWPEFLKNMLIAHPGALHSKKLFERIGNFNIKYKIVGDYEFLLRAGKELNAGFLEEVTVLMREGGASDSTKAIWEAHRAIIESREAGYFKTTLNTIWILIKYGIKNIARNFGMKVYLKKL